MQPSGDRVMHDPARLAPARTQAEAAWLRGDWVFARRVLIALGLAGLAYLVTVLSPVLVLIFAAILLAVLLRAFADLLIRAGIAASVALSLATIIVLAAIGAFFAMSGVHIFSQMRELVDQLPAALDALGQRAGLELSLSAALTEAGKDAAGGGIMGRIAGFGMTALGAIGDLFVIFTGAVFFASEPARYRDGAALLVPPAQRDRLHAAFDAIGNALRLWFGAQFLAMVAVGLLSFAAYWMIGLPSALALALIAGLTNFIPYLGPVLGGIPAILIAATISGTATLWTLAAVVAIQQIEGNVLTPRIQASVIAVPPALVIFSIMVFGALFGLAGVMLALPLAIVVIVFVQQLWLNAALGEHVPVTGETGTEKNDKT